MAWELGLILPKKKEGWYDAFRKRIIFPIFDLQQRIVGFGGRLIGEGQPKYINSSESSIYHKGEILYGLQTARRYVPEKESAIIVEGYFDLLTLHQYGWQHSVATLGTALTDQHIRTLKRYIKNLTMVFDPDPAGIQATLRTLPLFLEEEVSAKVVLLPKGEGPDSYFACRYKCADLPLDQPWPAGTQQRLGHVVRQGPHPLPPTRRGGVGRRFSRRSTSGRCGRAARGGPPGPAC